MNDGSQEQELIRLGLIKPGPDQVVKVHPARETERVNPARSRHKAHTPADFVDSAPVRCQVWDRDRLVAVLPVTFDDMGHPTDVVYQPKEREQATHLVFIWAGRVFRKPLGEIIHFSPSEPLHLALAHLKLRDKFGTLVLEAGKG